MLGQGAPTSLALGQLGSDYLQSTDGAKTGQWGIVYCIADCAFTTLTSGTLPDGSTKVMSGTLSTITLKAGMVLYGLFTAITVASGSIIAYKV